MKVLLIGGTGTISMSITRRLSRTSGVELTLLNRGGRSAELPENVKVISCDIGNEQAAKSALDGLSFDCVADFIVFSPEQLRRDIRLFSGKTKQYIFISSASAYEKPLRFPHITEETPLINPYWEYSRNKAECERILLEEYHKNGFPATIVRPSHTYDERNVPIGVHGNKGAWQVLKRMLDGKPVIIPGDGTSLWTCTASEDFAVGFCGLVGNSKAVGECFHITTDEQLCWNEIYGAVADALGVRLNPVHISSDLLSECCSFTDYRGSMTGDKSNSVIFDNSKIKAFVPEFSCKVLMRDGIGRSAKNMAAKPELQRADEEFDLWCDRLIAARERFIKDFNS